MDEIRREDKKLFMKEILRPSTIAATVGYMVIVGAMLAGSQPNPVMALALFLAGPVFIGLRAYSRSVDKRFIHPRFGELWEGCRDRHARFDAVLTQMRRERVADLQEMPKTIRKVAEALYIGLRRADLITDDVRRTEHDVVNKPPAWGAASQDRQAQELYQVADRNIAEYRQQFAGLMAGVQRTEAQAAVFMTTLDSLRVKMIGYRMVGRSPELSHPDFLSAMNEAKVQLHAIDRALEELDFGQIEKSLQKGQTDPPHLHSGSR